MSMKRAGLMKPERFKWYKNTYYDATDGTTYEVWASRTGDILIGASHDDVGLVTWYYANDTDWYSLASLYEEVGS